MVAKKIIITLTFILILSTPATSQVELPFEYFNGRWVDGHLVIDSIRHDDRIERFNFLSYSYTNNKLKIDATRYKLYNFFEKPDYSFRAHEFNVYFRPNKKWDMHLSFTPVNRYTNNGYDYYKRYYYGFETNYLKNGIAKIKSIHAPYSYRYNRLFDEGYFSFNSSIEYKHVKTSVYCIDIEAKFDNLNYLSRVQFNLAEGLNLYSKFSLEYQKSKNSFESGCSLIGEQSCRVNNNKDESLTKTFVEIGFIKAISSNFYINSSIKKHLFKQKQNGEDITIEITRYGDTLINTESLDYEIRLRSLSTEYKICLAYLTEGEFDEDIIISDYNNYYHNMLFKNQFATEFNVSIEDYNKGNGLKRNDYYFSLNLLYGLNNNIELGLKNNFRFYSCTFKESYYITYQKGIYFDSTFRHDASIGLNIKFRSYEFENNNWDSDSKYDIVYGKMLKFGQFYVELNTTLLRFKKSSEEERELFTLGDLKNNRREEFEFNSEFGLGRSFSFSSKFDFKNNYSVERDRIYYLISLQKRVFQKFELSFLYENLRYTDSRIQTGYHPEPTIIWKIKLLL